MRDIELRALIVVQNLLKVLSQSGTAYSASLGLDLKQEITRHIDEIYDFPNQQLAKAIRQSSVGFTPQLDDARQHAIKKVNNEIDFYVMGLERHATVQDGQSAPIHNFYGNVGAVQTGPSATANVFQTITQQDRDAILVAVDLLKKGLASVDRLPAHPKKDIVELVEEAEVETKKSKPNNSRLLSIFMTVATAIQAVRNLKPAYDMLNTALIPFGVQLP